MPGWVASVALTALLSMVSSWAFLVVRCRGLGRPFGPTSKWWAFAVVIITGAIATGLGVAVAAAGHHLRAAYIGLIVPSGLWLGKVAEQRHSRLRGRWRPEAEKLAGWLTFFVRRMDDRIGDDLEVWCDERLRAACGSPAVLGQATIYYHERIVARWPKGDRRRQALDRAKDSILHKVGVVQGINLGTTQLEARLKAHPSTRALVGKYTRKELEGRLLDSAENELRVMLADEYRRGRGKLLIYGLLAPGTLRSRAGSTPG